MATIFTRIIDGELPAHFVWRDEVDHWIDLPPEEAAHLMQVAREIGAAQMSAFSPVKVGLMIAGLEVPHTHVHVVPIRGVHDLDFANAASSVPQDELAAAAEAIRAALRSAGHGDRVPDA